MLSCGLWFVTKIVDRGVFRNSIHERRSDFLHRSLKVKASFLIFGISLLLSFATRAQSGGDLSAIPIGASCRSLVAEPYFPFSDFQEKIRINEIYLPYVLIKSRTGLIEMVQDSLTGQLKVVKHLNSKQIDSWGGGINSEINRFKILNHVLNKRSGAFRVVLPRIYEGGEGAGGSGAVHGIESVFVSGRTVHDLVLDENVDSKVREKVKAIFSSYLSDLAQAFHREEHEVLDEADPIYFASSSRPQLDGLKVFASEQNVWREGRLINEFLLIKSDNVIVDPYDLEKMTIIDPF